MSPAEQKPIKIIKQRRQIKRPADAGAMRVLGAKRNPPTNAVATGKASSVGPAVVWTLVGLVLAGLVAGSIVAIKNQAARDRAMQYRIVQAKRQAVKAFDELDGVADSVIALDSEADAHWRKFSDALGEYRRMASGRPAVPAVMPGTDTESGKPGNASVEDDPFKVELEPAPKQQVDADEEMETPEGIMPLSELLRLKEAERRRREESAGSPEGGAGYERRHLSRRESKADVLEKKAKAARGAVELNSRLAQELKSTAQHVNRIMREARTLDKVQRYKAELATNRQEIDMLLEQSRESLTTLDSCVEEITAMRDERLAKEEVNRQAAEKERKRREYTELVAREKRRVEILKQDLVALLETNKFHEALELAERVCGELHSTEARPAALIQVERCQRMAELFDFLVESIQDSGMSSGWIQDGTKRDILYANERVIGVQGVNIPWARVGQTQMMTMIEFCTHRPEVRLVTRASSLLSGAILFDTLGNPRYAETLKSEAVAMHSVLQMDVNRLF